MRRGSAASSLEAMGAPRRISMTCAAAAPISSSITTRISSQLCGDLSHFCGDSPFLAISSEISPRTLRSDTTQEAQVACFVNAAEHLRPGGHFVIEVGVPALRLLPPGQRAVPFAVSDGHWAYDLYDCATQAMSSNYVDDQRPSLHPLSVRVAVRARSDGSHRRHGSRGSLGRLGPQAIHTRKQPACDGVAKGELTTTLRRVPRARPRQPRWLPASCRTR
jgi:hypothetical protein